MPFKEYTKCVQPGDWHDLSVGLVGKANNLLQLLTIGFLAYLAIAVAGGPAGLIILLAIVLEAIAILRWYLYGRLICLGEDSRNCAVIGVLRGHSPSDPAWGEKYGDNDYNINLLLAPLGPAGFTSINDMPRSAFSGPPQGHLVEENTKITSIPRAYPKDGEEDVNHQKLLHCEFEGSGIFDLLNIAYVALAMILALLAIVALTSFPGGPALWLALAFVLALFAALLNLLFNTEPGPEVDPTAGNPLDVDPSLGNLMKGDVIVLRGGWIFDSGHKGWNEIHPVRHGQKIGFLADEQTWKDFSYTDPETGRVFALQTEDDFVIFRAHWCEALDDARDAVDGGNRENPEHDWGIHPTVDGCLAQPPVIL